MAESCSQVDPDPAVVAPPSNPIKNGKRGAEEVVEPQVVVNKKHKIVEKNTSGMETEESFEEGEHSSFQLAATTQDAKKASSSSESGQEGEDDNTLEDNAKHLETLNKSVEVPPAIKSGTTTHDDAEKASISNEYEEEDKDDSSKEDHQHLESPNRSALKHHNELLPDHPTLLDLATERDEHHLTHDMGSKTLYIGNLSFSIEEDDVDFFKNVGEIAEIRFAIKDDRFKGYGHIEFTTAEAAQEALKLNKEVLLDRRVKLELARRQRGAYTPGNSMEKSNQRGDNARGKTVYVRGFESNDGLDNIKSALEKHFGKCGEISRVCIPRDYVSGAPKGVAFIDFTESNGFSQALGLDGSEVGGNRLTVEEAKRYRGEGSGYGGGGSGGHWSEQNGSRGSWIRESGSGGRWSEGRWVRESGWSGGHWSGSRGSRVRESGSGGEWHREGSSRSNDRWHRESGSSYGSCWGRERSGSNGGGFSVGRGRGSIGNRYSSSISSSSHRGGGGGGFFSGRYDSRRPPSRP